MADGDVIREAKLFECGKYSDRGLDVAEVDLDRLVAGTVCAPISIEHMATPFDGALGVLRSVVRRGRELFGMLHFTAAAWALVQASNARRLSVRIAGKFERIVEVSLVRDPRIADAGFGSGLTQGAEGGMVFTSDSDFVSEGGKVKMEMNAELQVVIDAAVERGKVAGRADAETQFSARESAALKENADLKREGARSRAASVLAGWKAEGKLPPACEKFAEAMLVDGVAEVTFSDGGHMTGAEAFVQFMTHMPAVVDVVGEQAARDKGDADPAALKVYSELGVTLEQVVAAEAE